VLKLGGRNHTVAPSIYAHGGPPVAVGRVGVVADKEIEAPRARFHSTPPLPLAAKLPWQRGGGPMPLSSSSSLYCISRGAAEVDAVRLELPVRRCRHGDNEGGCPAPVQQIAPVGVSLPMLRCGDSIQACQGTKHDLTSQAPLLQANKHKHLTLVEPGLGWPRLFLLARLGGEENKTHPYLLAGALINSTISFYVTFLSRSRCNKSQLKQILCTEGARICLYLRVISRTTLVLAVPFT
jgi:hypothetical protein